MDLGTRVAASSAEATETWYFERIAWQFSGRYKKFALAALIAK